MFNEANRRRRFALCPELNERFGESEANVAVNKNIYASHEVLVMGVEYVIEMVSFIWSY